MKLRAITLADMRRVTAPRRVGGLSDGLNVLIAPNEAGKSTLFDALQAAFFKPYGSRDKAVMALRPHAGGAPRVTVEIERDGRSFTIAKRWLSKPAATVHEGGRLVAQADEAEAWIADVVGAEGGGPAGLIWVRQGLTGLEAGARAEDRAALEARRDLMSSVGAEVAAMTGGRRMDAALAQVAADLSELATAGTGKPRKGGPWHAALTRVDTLRAECDALALTAQDLADALEERRRARTELAEWQDPEAVAERQERLAAAKAAMAAAERHEAALDGARTALTLAALRAKEAASRLESHEAAQAERADAAEALKIATADQAKAEAALSAAREAREAAKATLEATAADRDTAETAFRAAERAMAARDGATRRAELADRIARAEAARQRIETDAAAAKTGPDARALQRLEALHAAREAEAARDAALSARVTLHYAEGRSDGVRIDGAPMQAGKAVPVQRALALEIDGIGTLRVEPAEGAGDGGGAAKAAEALRAALASCGVADIAAARAAAEARAAASARMAEARAVLDGVAPDGIDALRAARASIPEAPEGDAPDIAAAEAALQSARTAYDAARDRLDAVSEKVSDARDAATRADIARRAAETRAESAAAACAAAGDASVEDLRAALDAAARDEAQAAEVFRQAEADAPDLAAARADLDRATAIVEQAEVEMSRLRPALATLDERIRRSAGDAVEERLAETRDSLAGAEADAARIEREVAVLTRLQAALETARNAAQDRYFAPVAAHLRPMLALLWSEAELTWNTDDLLPAGLRRDGVEEPISILSGGTQEQVALLVRLAFARMLAEAGRPAPVILDDALVFTDDDRIERMFATLARQAADQQILVLTCRSRAFRTLGGRMLRFEDAAEDA